VHSEVLEKGEWIKMRCGTYVERCVDRYFSSLHAQKEQNRATARTCKLFCSGPIERRHMQKEQQDREKKRKRFFLLKIFLSFPASNLCTLQVRRGFKRREKKGDGHPHKRKYSNHIRNR